MSNVTYAAIIVTKKPQINNQMNNFRFKPRKVSVGNISVEKKIQIKVSVSIGKNSK